MVIEAFKEAFIEVVDAQYCTHWADDNEDRKALMTLPIVMGNDVEARYRDVATQYLKMLAKQANRSTGFAMYSLAYHNDDITFPFTLRAFLGWAQKRDLLPTEKT